jgi:transcriptional regulator with XRE-family HTH domain
VDAYGTSYYWGAWAGCKVGSIVEITRLRRELALTFLPVNRLTIPHDDNGVLWRGQGHADAPSHGFQPASRAPRWIRGFGGAVLHSAVVSVDDFWKQQAEGFGRFLRAQRKLADLSLRELAAMADVSNAYVSQLERGQHQPSVRVLRALAEALNISYQKMLTQAGVLEDDDLSDDRTAPEVSENPAAGRSGGAEPSSRRTLTEGAILADPLLTVEQKQALLAVYRGFVEIS